MSNPVRYRCELYASVELDEGFSTQTRLLELSEEDAFVEDAQGLEGLQVGDLTTLSLALPGGEPWVAQARVARLGRSRRDLKHARVDHVTVSAVGYALAFEALPDGELERLRDFLELLDGH